MEDRSLELEPGYSTQYVQGRCIKCLAEQKLDTCLREMLRNNAEDPKQLQKYEALLAFLQSTESEKLLEESERCLADGKQVTVSIKYEDGRIQYELKLI